MAARDGGISTDDLVLPPPTATPAPLATISLTPEALAEAPTAEPTPTVTPLPTPTMHASFR